MIRSVTITNYRNESIKLELRRPEKSGLFVYNISGLGPVQANINITEVATNDGGVYNSARLNTRNIVFSIGFLENPDIETMRQLTYKYFPIKQKIKMVFETDNRIAEIEGYVESNEPNIFSSMETATISVMCPRSYFYSGGIDGNTSTVFSGIEPMFEFPFSNESLIESLLEFGEIRMETQRNIAYDGDSQVGITIYINAIGDAKNITIYNLGTRESMSIDTERLKELTGSGIIAGDEIIITTTKGEKGITLLRGGKYTNILNCLGKNADWFQLSKGDNIFAYVAEEGSTNLQFRIENRKLYEGI